ncbi:glycine betaine transporter opud [hydrocarbon metagenome]|uniref:Glycine betaine transporter opud n=1 Tax=hydrocarbon metagenome TaxID=938273 RepID=A0A0W8FEA7_9ZZZZ
MLFAAGMGIGLIFWGVAEPLVHYSGPPEFLAPGTPEAASFAMLYSFFHWGLHPWAIYIIMSLSIAYFSFRREMPPLISSCFYPLLGERIYGIWGNLIDILAVFATIFGIATSLGLGALQIHSGLTRLYGIPDIMSVTFGIIAVATVLFMISSILGLDKGIQTLSKTNMLIAAVLLAFMLLVGPSSYIMNVFSSTLGEYANSLMELSLQSYPFAGYEWSRAWTIFYWAWWISWSPFVGLFVARISRGRTIRELVLGVLLVPTIFTFIWFSVFGGSALHLQLERGVDIAAVAAEDSSMALFALFEHYPLAGPLSLLAILLLFVFFVTSADSATFVLGSMTSRGSLHPPLYRKLVWGVVQSAVAVILLFTGGLLALQQMAIVAALPFTVVMVLLCYNLFAGLSREGEEGG